MRFLDSCCVRSDGAGGVYPVAVETPRGITVGLLFFSHCSTSRLSDWSLIGAYSMSISHCKIDIGFFRCLPIPMYLSRLIVACVRFCDDFP